MIKHDLCLFIANVQEGRPATAEEIAEHVRVVCVDEYGKIELQMTGDYRVIHDFKKIGSYLLDTEGEPE